MDDWNFKIPKKIIGWFSVALFGAAVLYGLITWDSSKGAALFLRGAEIVSKPISDRLINRFHRIMEEAMPDKNQEKVTP